MKQYIARYGAMRLLGIFAHSAEDSDLFHGTKVIVRTSRGLETAVVLCEATPEALEELPPEMEENRLIRIMTPIDENESRKIREGEKDDFFRCQAIVKRMKIDMDLVRVEHIFGGERLIVYYVAEGRIDFRELVRVLASEFQTRIEMKQIGVRDETKLVADVGDCGREVCCNSYLIAMPPVSMKMAKLQKATLDPTKISGRCGRLKCCLRYEYDVYREIVSILPPIGKLVSTPDGNGRVISQELLAKKVVVELLADHTRKTFDGAEVALLSTRAPEDKEKRTFDRSRRDRTQSERTDYRDTDDDSTEDSDDATVT
ncbi:MAG: regulatory iron-sulfur-containing complex subunit RicT [Planctomycetia bacterium]|nr:regulatory iron-sulfur-containing complex subunit RicT [Planctomycetia bacterium]